MNTTTRIAGLVVLGVAQLAAPAWSIARYERTLRHGAPYRILVEPVDPADAFRGRYVAVQPTITLPLPIDDETRRLLEAVSGTRKVYVRLATDDQGFARAGAILEHPPSDGDYLQIAHAWTRWTPNPNGQGESENAGYTLRFSFDRYYMNERQAPAAEQSYASAVRRGSGSRAWLAIRVREGAAVIEGLFIDGVPIERAVQQ